MGVLEKGVLIAIILAPIIIITTALIIQVLSKDITPNWTITIIF